MGSQLISVLNGLWQYEIGRMQHRKIRKIRQEIDYTLKLPGFTKKKLYSTLKTVIFFCKLYKQTMRIYILIWKRF